MTTVPIARVIVHAAVIAAMLYLSRFGARALHAHALVALLDYLSTGWFIIFALTASSAMHNQKTLVLAITILVPMGAAPFANMEAFAHVIVPIGAGVLLGSALRPAFAEWTDHERSSTESLHKS